MNSTLYEGSSTAGVMRVAYDVKRHPLFEEACNPEPGRVGDTKLAVAEALKEVRTCLEEGDCLMVPEVARHSIFARARELGEAIGPTFYNGMAVFEEDGVLELVADNFSANRRVSIAFLVDKGYRCSQITPSSVSRTGWAKRAYDIKALADWLMNRS